MMEPQKHRHVKKNFGEYPSYPHFVRAWLGGRSIRRRSGVGMYFAGMRNNLDRQLRNRSDQSHQSRIIKFDLFDLFLEGGAPGHARGPCVILCA